MRGKEGCRLRRHGRSADLGVQSGDGIVRSSRSQQGRSGLIGGGASGHGSGYEQRKRELFMRNFIFNFSVNLFQRTTFTASPSLQRLGVGGSQRQQRFFRDSAGYLHLRQI